MRRTEALQGVRMMRFLDILGRYEAAEFNQLEAAALLGVSERTFRRWQARYEEEGEAGLLDRRLGKASGKRVPVDRAQEVEALYRQRYAGFRAKHFHEHLVKDHGFAWGYPWTKTFLQSRGLLPKASRKGAHRRKRERRPLPGMMLHQDGSRHVWLEGQPALDLHCDVGRRDGAIYSAFLVEEEGTASTFRALKETFGSHGLPLWPGNGALAQRCGLYASRLRRPALATCRDSSNAATRRSQRCTAGPANLSRSSWRASACSQRRFWRATTARCNDLH